MRNRKFNNNSWRLHHPFLIKDRRTRQMKTEDFNNISINIPTKSSQVHFFFRCTSCVHIGVFSSTYMLGHKTSINKFQKTEMKDAVPTTVE